MTDHATSFTELGIDKRIIQSLESIGINAPTPIQAYAVPVANNGHDLLASSKTGSGKTFAFLLPAMQRLLKKKSFSKRDPRILIVLPTRELAKQVFAETRKLFAGSSLKASLIVGGENFNDQAKSLAKDPHVVVGTPGRLSNHIDDRSIMLTGLEMLILDEADRTLDLGFREQLEQINHCASHRLRQTLMFSATLDTPEVRLLAATLLKEPKTVSVGDQADKHSEIEQRFYLGDHLDHKQALLLEYIKTADPRQCIIFTATRDDSERLATLLTEEGYKSAALHGDMTQGARNKVMDDFSRERFRVLVTTDVASRGLDVLNVSLVVNFDMPKAPEEYIHRIGRTGRAGQQGSAVSIVGPRDWDAFKRVESLLKQTTKFSVIEGMEPRFKGIHPKRHPVSAKRKPRNDQTTTYTDQDGTKRPMNRPKRGSSNRVISGDGFAPLKRKKDTEK